MIKSLFTAEQPISQRFGENPDIYAPLLGHPGIDFAAPKGTPVYSPISGDITLVQDNKDVGYGLHAKISNGVYTLIFAHLDKCFISTGDKIKRGDKVGDVGNSGWCISSSGGDGSHLHFEVRPHDGATVGLPKKGFNGAVDPESIPYDEWIDYAYLNLVSSEKKWFSASPSWYETIVMIKKAIHSNK